MQQSHHWLRSAAILSIFLAGGPLFGKGLPLQDERAKEVRTLNTLRTFPAVESRTEWERRARDIREHVLVSCGLWPMPKRTPLKAKVFDRVEREGYSVEKVYFQSYPGVYVAGNLYRPLGRGAGPFPGVLNPHGHWKNGRLADEKLGSIAARCINFARQGMVAFSWDMMGYNDSKQVDHQFAKSPENALWNISLMGLQTWNSIRALDFLEELPDVDSKRLACTGESGGGTQTFMLGAIDSRLAVQAPIVMVSHSMQGGCLCENAPGLRVDYSNMEISAVPAPRPQIIVAATGDWTKKTMEVEGPAIEKVYNLFGARDKFKYTIFNFDHNYNQTTREAVYGFFGKSLLNNSEPEVKEIDYKKEPDEALRVFADGKMPEDAKNEEQLASYLRDLATEAVTTLKGDALQTAWRHTMAVELPDKGLIIEAGTPERSGDGSQTGITVGREGRGDRVKARLLTPKVDNYRMLVLLAHPDGMKAYLDASKKPQGLAKAFLDRHYSVLIADLFLTGDHRDTNALEKRKHHSNYFSTYNRTDLQERVQDLVTLTGVARRHEKGRKVILCGEGRAGLWTMLATPAADGLIADAGQVDALSDKELLEQDLFVPGLRRIGGFKAGLALGESKPILIHNTSESFRQELGTTKRKGLKIQSGKMPDEELLAWVSSAK